MNASSASPESPPGAKPTRRLGLDILRGIAVFLMIEQHLGVWLWDSHGRSLAEYPVLVVFNALGGGAAPLFIVLAGIGSGLMILKEPKEGVSISVDRTLVVRGLTILAFGYLLSFATPSWFSVRSWFVLHLIGFGMAITPLLRRIPTWLLLTSAAMLLLSTGPVQALLDTPQAMRNPYMSARGAYIPSFAGLRIAVAEGQFPILPWLTPYILGLVCGRWIHQGRVRNLTVLALALLVSGAIAGAIWQLGTFETGTAAWRNVRIHVPFFPASPALVCLILGPVILAVRAIIAVETRTTIRADHPLVCLGRASLTLLLVHVVLFRELTRPLGLWRALDMGTAMAVLCGFVMLSLVLSRRWQRGGYRFGAEWVLRKVAG